jgi:hypothetical protein
VKPDGHYERLRKKAAERSRARRKLTGEPAPGRDWHCSRCRRDVKKGDACPGCGTVVSA